MRWKRREGSGGPGTVERSLACEADGEQGQFVKQTETRSALYVMDRLRGFAFAPERKIRKLHTVKRRW